MPTQTNINYAVPLYEALTKLKEKIVDNDQITDFIKFEPMRKVDSFMSSIVNTWSPSDNLWKHEKLKSGQGTFGTGNLKALEPCGGIGYMNLRMSYTVPNHYFSVAAKLKVITQSLFDMLCFSILEGLDLDSQLDHKRTDTTPKDVENVKAIIDAVRNDSEPKDPSLKTRYVWKGVAHNLDNDAITLPCNERYTTYVFKQLDECVSSLCLLYLATGKAYTRNTKGYWVSPPDFVVPALSENRRKEVNTFLNHFNRGECWINLTNRMIKIERKTDAKTNDPVLKYVLRATVIPVSKATDVSEAYSDPMPDPSQYVFYLNKIRIPKLKAQLLQTYKKNVGRSIDYLQKQYDSETESEPEEKPKKLDKKQSAKQIQISDEEEKPEKKSKARARKVKDESEEEKVVKKPKSKKKSKKSDSEESVHSEDSS